MATRLPFLRKFLSTSVSMISWDFSEVLLCSMASMTSSWSFGTTLGIDRTGIGLTNGGIHDHGTTDRHAFFKGAAAVDEAYGVFP